MFRARTGEGTVSRPDPRRAHAPVPHSLILPLFPFRVCHPRQVGTNAPSSGYHCFSGTLSPLPLGTSLSCPQPSTATPDALERLGFQSPTAEDCGGGENAPLSFTFNSQQCCIGPSSHSLMETVTSAQEPSMSQCWGRGPGRGRNQRLRHAATRTHPSLTD